MYVGGGICRPVGLAAETRGSLHSNQRRPPQIQKTTNDYVIDKGNADGTFIYTGFRPAFVIYKSIGVQSWYMLDSGRSSYNVADDYLEANNSNQEYSGAAQTDFVSNGLKIRTSAGGINNSSVTFIYLAFAESPFKTSNAR